MYINDFKVDYGSKCDRYYVSTDQSGVVTGLYHESLREAFLNINVLQEKY